MTGLLHYCQGMMTAALVGGAALLALFLTRKLLATAKGKPQPCRAEHAEHTASRKRTDRPGCAGLPWFPLGFLVSRKATCLTCARTDF